MGRVTPHHGLVYAATIAAELNLSQAVVEDIKAAAHKGSICSSRWRLAAPGDSDYPRSSRQVRRLRIPPDKRREYPIEANIISVADVYDSLTSDRPYRKAMSPFDARGVIAKGSETEFDPAIVTAFQRAFRQGKLKIWSAPLTAA